PCSFCRQPDKRGPARGAGRGRWLALPPRSRCSKAPSLVEADGLRWHANEGEASSLGAAQDAPLHVIATGGQVQFDVAQHDPVRATTPAARREDEDGAADLVEQFAGAASPLPDHGRSSAGGMSKKCARSRYCVIFSGSKRPDRSVMPMDGK